MAIWWPAFTVSEPSGFWICSLKMYVKLSPTLLRTPVYVVFGSGLVGTITYVSSPSMSGSPSEV